MHPEQLARLQELIQRLTALPKQPLREIPRGDFQALRSGYRNLGNVGAGNQLDDAYALSDQIHAAYPELGAMNDMPPGFGPIEGFDPQNPPYPSGNRGFGKGSNEPGYIPTQEEIDQMALDRMSRGVDQEGARFSPRGLMRRGAPMAGPAGPLPALIASGGLYGALDQQSAARQAAMARSQNENSMASMGMGLNALDPLGAAAMWLAHQGRGIMGPQY